MKMTLCNSAGGTTHIKRFNYIFHYDGRPVEVDLNEQKLNDLMSSGLITEYVAPEEVERKPEIQNERDPAYDEPVDSVPPGAFKVGTATPDWG